MKFEVKQGQRKLPWWREAHLVLARLVLMNYWLVIPVSYWDLWLIWYNAYFNHTINHHSTWIILASVSDLLVSFKMKAYYDAGKQVLARRLLRDLPVKVIKWSSTVGGPTMGGVSLERKLNFFPRGCNFFFQGLPPYNPFSKNLCKMAGRLLWQKIRKWHPNKPSPSHPSRGRSSIQEGKALAATLPGAVYIQADCSSREGCEGLIQEVAEKCGQLDLLVCHSSWILICDARIPMIFINDLMQEFILVLIYVTLEFDW